MKDEPSSPDLPVKSQPQSPSPEPDSPDPSRPPPRPIKIESGESVKMEDVSEDIPLETFDEDTIYRRVDLIFAPPVAYWTAVVGWWVTPLRYHKFYRLMRFWGAGLDPPSLSGT